MAMVISNSEIVLIANGLKKMDKKELKKLDKIIGKKKENEHGKHE